MIPLVTILMSVYNGERWLDESIQSVLNQTFTNFEFIIVNDGSVDSSLSIANKYACSDSRIRVLDKQNTGLADSLNYGIGRARGAWICRIDADDLCLPSRIRKQIELANSDPRLVLVGSGLRLLDQDGKKGNVFKYPANHRVLVNRLRYSGAFFPHSSAVYKTDLVRELGGYRGRIKRAEDHDLWLRLSEVGEIGCVKEPLVLIRKHNDQISHDDGGKRQLIDACVAKVSYWLRTMGHQDPVQYLSDAEFIQFHSWVEMGMVRGGTFDLIDFVHYLKKVKSCDDSRFMRFFTLLFSVISSPQKARRWMRERMWGSKLPKQIAEEWASRAHD